MAVELIELLGRDRLVRCAGDRELLVGPRRFARLIIVLDLRLPVGERLPYLVVEDHRRVIGVFAQPVEVIVKERQPVLEPREPLPGADRPIERIVAGVAPEHGGVAGPEALDGFVVEQHLAHGRQRNARQVTGGPLRVGVEGPDAFERVAEEVEAERCFHTCGIEVDQSAAHGVLAGLPHRRHADIAVERSPFDQPVAVDHLPRFCGKAHAGDDIERRQFLDVGVDGSEDDRAAGRLVGEGRNRRHAGGDGDAVGGDAVVWQAIPGGQRQDRMPGQHGAQHVVHALQTAAVAGDEHRRDPGVRRGLEPILDHAGKSHRLHAVGHVDDGSGRAGQFGHWADFSRKAMMV